MANVKRPDTSSKKETFFAAIRSTFGSAIRAKSSDRVSKIRIVIATLVILAGGALTLRVLFPAPMRIADDELNRLVNVSTLTFVGTVKEMDNSNVTGVTSSDFPMIVQVDEVESGDQQALKKFGDLKGNRLTVAVNLLSRVGMQNNISAVFFAEPLIYETNIAVVATAIPLPNSKQDFLNKLHAAGFRKAEAPLRAEVASAELIITGKVDVVRALASDKAEGLRSVRNGWEVFSEHRPRWKEAIVKVDFVAKPVEQGEKRPEFVSVAFADAHDCMFSDSPKFQANQSGIWLLHRNQVDEQEAKVLFSQPDKHNGADIQTYTALRPADFQDLAMLGRIQQIIAQPR
jgi:hypothetical protein